jgi:hypothetical protein
LAGRDWEDRGLRPVWEKKVIEVPSQPIKIQVWWPAIVIPVTKKAQVGGLWFRLTHAKM